MWFIERILQRAVCFKGGGGGGAIVTEDMRAAAEVGVKQWNDYQNRYVKFEDKFIKDVNQSPEVSTDKVQGMVNADIAQRSAAPSVNPVKPVAAPSSGRGMAAGMIDARAGELDRKAQGVGTVVAMGRGQQTEALNGMTDQAVTSGMVASQKAITDSKVATAERGQTFGMIGTALGAAGGVAANYNGGGVAPSYETAPGQTAGPSVVNADYNTASAGMNRTVTGGRYLQPVTW